ncbi:hypothetical protein D8M04_15375 [Oceanobacillus piezotolerans]|uniref:Tetratricopeptide repeat protein n=1 Tax=Oceanobacillus piezotolerans TaxID=2448030 RepID=A0A498D6Z0_9BACI|nr:AimR family lysis-lysogeny pheromone receptor [Oceanobacillus piezotolerans]RLL42924.1 hypothetical protein D8M04_15375 [Oceanobacillus piezotolerans]
MLSSRVSVAEDLTLEQALGELKTKYHHDKAINIMRELCLESRSDDFIKKGMEFLFMNGFYEDLQALIKKNLKSKDVSVINWAKTYQAQLELHHKDKPYLALLADLNEIKTAEPELLFLMEYTRAKAHYIGRDYNELAEFVEKSDSMLNLIDDCFLLKNFRIRASCMVLLYTLTRNELIIARKHGYKILTLTRNPSIQVNVHIHLGLSYTFESHYKGMYHLKEALRIAKEHHLSKEAFIIEHRSIPFLSAHFGVVDNITTTDKSEQAHIEIAKGNNDKAIEILNEIPLDSPFKTYYLGKAKEDKSLLLKSYREFIHKNKDFFFSRLPLTELKKTFV